jgi:hypothetical protein
MSQTVTKKTMKDEVEEPKKKVEEVEEKTESDDEEEVKIDMLKNLKYDFASYEIDYIYNTYLANDGEINLSPPYQREFAWNNDKQDLFIDSIMNNYIIPPIILIKLHGKNQEYRYECMDGQHRLTVLKHFIESKPINPENPHYIRFTKTEDDKKMNIFYEKKKRFDDIKDKRFMTADELQTFNDKKIIIIKISNYDPKLANLFGTVKNEMFLRLQKGERAGGTDILRNCEHPLITELKKRGLMAYKTYDEVDEESSNDKEEDSEDKDTETSNDKEKEITKEKQYFSYLKDILIIKTKKVPQKLTFLVSFILKSMLVIKLESLDIGGLTDNKLKDDIVNSKTTRFTLKSKQNWNTYLQTFNTFLADVRKYIKDTQVSQNLMLLLLYVYVAKKDDYNTIVSDKSSLEKLTTKFTESYFKTLLSYKEGNKIKKLQDGSRLKLAYPQLQNLFKKED